MATALMNNYSKEELEVIVRTSNSLKECLRKMGYKTDSGDTPVKLKNRIEMFEIDMSHFNIRGITPVKRTEENVFCKDATCSQATLRRHYKEGNYSKYECSICGQSSTWNGKDLTLILDHIDGQNKNNELDNLRWVCPNCNIQLPTTGSRNIKKENVEKKFFCMDCGKEITRGAIRCIECAHKLQMKCEHPSRDELKYFIRTMSFTTIGSKYNVSDNAIRRWCDNYSLPRSKRQINKYSDKEWEVI